MGISIWGMSSGFQGKNGGNIGRWVDGKNVVGPLPHPSQKPATQGQLDSRAKFSLLTSFVNAMLPLVDAGMQFVRTGGQTSSNAAFKVNYPNVTGVSPNFTMDYPKVVFSKGSLSKPGTPEVETAVVAEVKFNWTNVFNEGYGAGTDEISVMVYNPLKDQFVFKTAAAVRSALTYTLLLPADFSGDTVQCYISAVAADGKKVSDSQFIGAIAIL